MLKPSEEPLPCPWCGCHEIEPFRGSGGHWFCICRNSACKAEGPWHPTRDLAVESWNRVAKLAQ